MDKTTIAQQVHNFIQANYLLGRADSLQDNDSFLEGGIIDSTGVLELVGFLQETYDIEMEDHELVPENLDSINSVSAFVSRKLSQKTKTDFTAVPENVREG